MKIFCFVNYDWILTEENWISNIIILLVLGNWSGKANFKLKFFKGGAIEFGQAMLRAAKMGMF